MENLFKQFNKIFFVIGSISGVIGTLFIYWLFYLKKEIEEMLYQNLHKTVYLEINLCILILLGIVGFLAIYGIFVKWFIWKLDKYFSKKDSCRENIGINDNEAFVKNKE